MHRSVARRSRQACTLRHRIGPALAIAVLLASPLAAGLVGERGFSTIAGGASGAVPRPSALVNETYVPTSYSEVGYGLAGAVATTRALPAELPIVVTLGFSNASELSRLLHALSDPSSPEYHHYLTAGQFDAAFAPSSSTYAAAVAYFEALGARALHTFTDRVTISFEASPSSVDRMFHTTVQEWSFAGRAYYAPATPVELPVELASAVSAVVGLSSFARASTSSGSGAVPMTPSPPAVPALHAANPSGYLPPAVIQGLQYQYGPDLQVAYDEQSLFREAGYPTNAVIATILWQGYYNGSAPTPTPYGELNPGQPVGAFVPSDVQAYFNQSSPPGQPHAVAIGVPVGGAMPSGPLASYDTTGASTENTLDMEMAGSLAPGATVFDVYGTMPTYPELDTAFAFILNPNASYPALARVSVISNSWGDLDAVHTEWNQYVEEATARGITVLASTGDSGDYPNSPWQVGNPANVNTTFPSSLATDTYGVLAVGGTAITMNALTLQINSSVVWNVPSEQMGTTSGISPVYAEPSWQASSSANGLIRGLGRGVPDIAAIATRVLLTITDNGYQYNATNASSIGMSYGEGTGTSVACPVEAGVIAEIDHVLGAQHQAWLGFLQPTLYRLADEQYAPLIQTPTTGYLNGTDYTSPLPTLPVSDTVNGSNHYYAAAPGYDLVTGWGSLDAYNYTMYVLATASAGVNGRLSGVENNFTLDALAVTSHGAQSFFNASIQQNLFIANSLGAPVYWIQNVIYINWTASGWAMNDSGWIAYPFYGLYYSLLIYEYNFPLVGQRVGLPATFDLRTVLDPGVGFNNQSIEYFVGSHQLSLPVPGAAYIIGSLWYNYSWQGTEHENGPFPGNPIPGGLSPQFGLVGGPTGGLGEFSAPTNGSMVAKVLPYGSSTFETASTRTFYESIDQTGEDAQGLAWTNGPSGQWTLGTSAGSTVQGVLSYEPTGQYLANFTAGGLPAGTLWFVNISRGASYSSTTPTISVPLPSGTFEYNISSSDPHWEPLQANGTVTIDGAPRVIDVAFGALPSSIVFFETGLPAATSWTVLLGSGQNGTSSQPEIAFYLLNGTYSFRVHAALGEWAAHPSLGSVTVAGDTVAINITFSLEEYSVSFHATGLAAGTGWFVNITGGANYTSSSSTITFLATNGTYLFSAGTNATYHVAPPSGSLTVAGSNVSQTIQFSPPNPGTTSYPGWIADVLALVGAVIAVAILSVILLTRRRPRPPS